MTITDILKSYKNKLDHLDLELILAHSLGKTREFVLTYPEFTVTGNQQSAISKNIKRRIAKEPLAYILGHKEFYGLDFIVDKNTLIPRPETELIVELARQLMSTTNGHQSSKKNIIDVGTGSGNIIISVVKKIQDDGLPMTDYSFYGIDISRNALKISRLNAKKHKVNKKIKFLQGNLLTPLLKANKLMKLKPKKLIVVANLPYLSKEIYSSAPADVKKYEPKSALYSSNAGLAHYKKLLKQIKGIFKNYNSKNINCIFEISPEQKNPLTKFIKNIFPSAKITFLKDLAGKWRVCKISLV